MPCESSVIKFLGSVPPADDLWGQNMERFTIKTLVINEVVPIVIRINLMFINYANLKSIMLLKTRVGLLISSY
jgi:hypothetical protein